MLKTNTPISQMTSEKFESLLNFELLNISKSDDIERTTNCVALFYLMAPIHNGQVILGTIKNLYRPMRNPSVESVATL